MSADGQYIRLNTKTNAALLKLKLTEVFTDPAFSLISLVEYIESVFWRQASDFTLHSSKTVLVDKTS